MHFDLEPSHSELPVEASAHLGQLIRDWPQGELGMGQPKPPDSSLWQARGTVVLPSDGLQLTAAVIPVAEAKGTCLIVPPFGAPAEMLRVVQDILAARGIASAVLDPRNHVGASGGEIVDFTMSGFAHDCCVAIDAFQPDCVAAVSLGARATMRAVANVGSVGSAVYLLPVIHVRSTLNALLGVDRFGCTIEQLPPLTSVLGHDVASAGFRLDCEEHSMVTEASTLADLAAHTCDISLLSGDRDQWVDFGASVQLAIDLGKTADIRLQPLQIDNHLFHEDAAVALEVVSTLIAEVERMIDERNAR